MATRRFPTSEERAGETLRGFLSDREMTNTNRPRTDRRCITCDASIDTRTGASAGHCTNRRCLSCHAKRCDHGDAR